MSTLFLDACFKKNNSGLTPIWMMRQAGRYLPEYQGFRKQFSFKKMMSTPDIATEVTLQPIRRFGMDAAILFSDILVTAEALGFPVDFIEKKGPVFQKRFEDVSQLNACPSIRDALPYVFQTISNLKKELKIHLVGFAGAPFTVASYMIEGGSSQTLETVKKRFIQDPASCHALLDRLADVTIAYLQAQLEDGVDAIQLFDTWAGLLSQRDFTLYSLPYIRKIVSSLDTHKPILLYLRNTSAYIDLLKELPIQVLSLDWQSSLSGCAARVPFAIQGNLDPQLLLGGDKHLKPYVDDILEQMKGHPGHIFNLGHGILPGTNPDTVKQMIEWVREKK